MEYFDDRKNVQDYIEMTKGYAGEQTLSATQRHVAKGSRILELGMGPGHDLEVLKKDYSVIGSDASQIFLDIYFENHPGAQLHHLDAVTIDIPERFDCIYSNKVLHQLGDRDLSKSFQRQHQTLNSGGLAIHSFWLGKGEDSHEGMRYWLRDEGEIRRLIAGLFSIIEVKTYEEFEPKDSFCITLKRV